ncbi:MAG: hypothetical protein ABIG42_12015, partial [bacterium]
ANFDSSGKEESSGNIFGSLRFDFSQITIDTERTSLIVVDGELVSLECPDPTYVTTAENTLTMPSCALTFNPPSLNVTEGIELLVGDETKVDAGSLILSYPDEGNMFVQFSGDASFNPDNPEIYEGMPLVTITHPAGIFSAACITIFVHDDGTHRIEANGTACFEIPLTVLTNTVDEVVE